MDEEFKLFHNEGKLYAVITIKGENYEIDVTDYFNNHNPHDDWLDFRLGLMRLTKIKSMTHPNT
ncbi:hypothetical protein LG276_00945 [Cytobacillus kochii]|uniref:hypothetical protein n=1 Tax=Cytobacillus kochii TaxID=859143 RepID=UPI00384D8480